LIEAGKERINLAKVRSHDNINQDSIVSIQDSKSIRSG